MFYNELNLLQQNKPSNKSKKLTVPTMIGNAIHVRGRLKHSYSPEDSKHSIIMSKRYHATYLLLDHIHISNFHCGRTFSIFVKRQILDKRMQIRLLNHCQIIFLLQKTRSKTSSATYARITHTRHRSFNPSFTHIGIDYFGPISIKRGRRTRVNMGIGKRYRVLFTCLTYRIIHLQLAGDLISRRGTPRHISSDNGKSLLEQIEN